MNQTARTVVPRIKAWIGCIALVAICLEHPAFAAPQIFWASDPVQPDETVVVTGEDFGEKATIELGRFPDHPDTGPSKDTIPKAESWEPIVPIDPTSSSLKFIVPESWPPGMWACRVRQGDEVSAPMPLNAPTVWWWNGDQGETASPGGWIRVFGKSLNFGARSRAVLRAADGKEVQLIAEKPTNYALTFQLPGHVSVGEYSCWIHNGFGGNSGWRNVGTVVVRSPADWPQEIFHLKDFGKDPGKALLSALEKARTNGGGIVLLPRGRYPVASTLKIPPKTILRGEGMELTSLYWPDFEKPPEDLIQGADSGIESLTIYCQHHRNVISEGHASQRFFVRKVRIRANCYFMIEEVGKEFRGRKGPTSHKECGAAIMLRGRNFEVTDCDIYASHHAIYLMKAKTGQIARNRFRYGGRGYTIENTERLIFEDNLVEGNNLLAIGNDISTFWNNSCRHIYYANNVVRQIYGADREITTLDAAGGAYFGKLKSATGTSVVLENDPTFHDYRPTPRTDWVGAAVQILAGRGTGQYRFVTSHRGREWEIDRPWIVEPDHTSQVSIAPFRGQNLFIGNTFEDGGNFQLYAAAHDSIVAGNLLRRTDGMAVWGLNPHAWGYQPSWYCQFFDNQILEGNAFGHRAATFATIAYDETKSFDGPLVLGTIFRRNRCHNNAGFRLGGSTTDTLVEHCTVKDAEVGIKVAPTAKNVLLRKNTFENVDQPEVR